MTEQPEDPSRPDNLWNPVAGDHGAHGDFDARARDRSWQLWATMHRPWLATAGIVGAALLCRSLLGKRVRSVSTRMRDHRRR
jgi:hypothetical protein